MNLLGRIFVVLNLVMSLVFMTLAVSVWAINKNYVGALSDLRGKMQTAQADLQQVQNQRDQLEKQLKAETAIKQMQVGALEQARASEQRRFDEVQQQFGEMQKEASSLSSAIQVQQKLVEGWTNEVNTSRSTLVNAQQQRDQLWEVARTKTDEAAQLAQEVATLEAINDQLEANLDVAQQTLDANNIRVAPASPGVIEGLVVEVKNRLVLVSIGSDDGVQPEDTLEVVNGSRYLGRIRILRVQPDKAVGEILDDYQQGVIRKGDDVRSGFKVG